jgi:hypothetical protein
MPAAMSGNSCNDGCSGWRSGHRGLDRILPQSTRCPLLARSEFARQKNGPLLGPPDSGRRGRFESSRQTVATGIRRISPARSSHWQFRKRLWSRSYTAGGTLESGLRVFGFRVRMQPQTTSAIIAITKIPSATLSSMAVPSVAYRYCCIRRRNAVTRSFDAVGKCPDEDHYFRASLAMGTTLCTFFTPSIMSRWVF